MTRQALSILVLMLTAALPALGKGGDQGSIELGLYAGFASLDDYGIGSSSLNPDDDILFGVRVGTFLTSRWSLEISAQHLPTETQFDPVLVLSDVDFEITSFRANLLHNFRPGRMFRPFLTFGAGFEGTKVDTVFDVDDAGYNAGGGLRWFLNDSFGVRLDARWILTDLDVLADEQQNLETSFGLLWAFGGGPAADSDGDGVADRRDRCPGTPSGAVVDERGCPIDSDGDGVADGIDRCPGTAAGVPVDASGCPRDSDGDGVHDGVDSCPDTPRGATVDPRGCPLDGDGDGVYDGIDECPDTPRGATVDSRGCPQDGDGDGVYDGIDECPDTPRGATVDSRGCPQDGDGDGVYDGIDKCPDTPRGVKVDVKGCQALFEEERRTLVLEGVNFEFDNAELTPTARTMLDRVAMSLQQWPEIYVEVAGHTDSVGNDAYNRGLSEQRAESVRAYLVGRGVDSSRLTARGYGETKPIADNGTKEGRDRNRRVELRRPD